MDLRSNGVVLLCAKPQGKIQTLNQKFMMGGHSFSGGSLRWVQH